MKPVLIYLLSVNALGFLLMLIDKYKARKKLWRIPEATLMWVAALGGSLGSLLGMYTVRHKTKHPKFTIGVPVLRLTERSSFCEAIFYTVFLCFHKKATASRLHTHSPSIRGRFPDSPVWGISGG